MATISKTKSKKAQLEHMLRRKSGVDVQAISERFGLQPQTTRAALSCLRKAGLIIVREAGSGGQSARYRIVSPPSATLPSVADAAVVPDAG